MKPLSRFFFLVLNKTIQFKMKSSRKREARDFFKAKTESQIRKDSYYSDCELKPVHVIIREITELYVSDKGCWRMQDTYDCYMLFGLDRAGTTHEAYLFRKEFDRLRDKGKPSYAMILNHKIFTLVYLKGRGINVSQILGQVSEKGVFGTLDGSLCEDFYTWLAKRESPVFCKLPDGSQGASCFVLEQKGTEYLKNGKSITKEELDALLPHLQIEEIIQQHEGMAAIYPNAVNTCRMVTVLRNGKPEFFSGYALFGCGGTRVSNGRFGGLFAGYDENGHLSPFAIREFEFGGGVYQAHPDTGTVFKDCTIPFFKEALELAYAAHRVMDSIKCIGWDIAITPKGPVIIEGNQGFATAELQIFKGGMRREAYELLG